MVISAPALPAIAFLGATYTTTGTVLARIRPMISSVVNRVTARRVQLDDQNFRITLFGGLDAALDVFQHRRHDRTICGHDEDQRLVALSLGALERKQDSGQKYE